MCSNHVCFSITGLESISLESFLYFTRLEQYKLFKRKDTVIFIFLLGFACNGVQCHMLNEWSDDEPTHTNSMALATITQKLHLQIVRLKYH